MILGNLSDINETKFFFPVFQKVLDYLKKKDLFLLKEGKHIIQGDDIFAIVMNYKTSPKNEKKAEVHKKFVDIHLIISGEESIGVGFLKEEPENCFDENDSATYTKVEDEKYIPLFPGDFIILFPKEIHRPGCILSNPANIKKVVIKIKADLINKY